MWKNYLHVNLHVGMIAIDLIVKGNMADKRMTYARSSAVQFV